MLAVSAGFAQATRQERTSSTGGNGHVGRRCDDWRMDGPTDVAWPLEGSFRCGDGFLVKPECFGQTFQSRTATHAISLTLPEIRSGSLTRPPWRFVRDGEVRDAIPATDTDDLWGSVASSSSGNPRHVHILKCVVHSELAATDDETFKTGATRFGNELADWWALACDWLDVLSLQDFAGLGRAQRSILNDSLQMWSGDLDGIRRAGVNYQVMTGGMNWVEVLDRQQLQAAMDLAASDSSPHAEWLFVRDARSLLGAGEYRRAVIDACTAAELSVTSLVDRKFDLAGTSQSDREEKFAQHHGLAKLIELHNSFKTGKLPKRLYQEVGAPRNKAAHVGAMLSEPEARTALAKAAEVVEIAYPLGAIASTVVAGQLRATPEFGVLPQSGVPLVLTTGNDLVMSMELRRRDRPPPRQPPTLTGVRTNRQRWWQLWRR